jgi:hypothetical protein
VRKCFKSNKPKPVTPLDLPSRGEMVNLLNFPALSFGLQKRCFFFSREEVGFVSLLEEGLREVIIYRNLQME